MPVFIDRCIYASVCWGGGEGGALCRYNVDIHG